MPNWFYEKKDLRNTPSIKSGGCDYETEMRYRREGARFIQELGRALGLGHDAMATGSVYFHRFYMFHSFSDFPQFVTAACALFLAGKTEETPKKIRDLTKIVRSLINDERFITFGKDPREEILTLERVLLQTIKFDLQVSHPYTSLIKFAKCLKGDSARLQKMVQMSWTFINDSLCTTLCLQWEPEIISIAVMHLAGKLSKFNFKDWNNKTPDHKHWWDQYVQFLSVDTLEDICHQVLDLYSHPTTNIESPLKSIQSKLPQSTPPDQSRTFPQFLPQSHSTTKMLHSPALSGPQPRKPGSPSGSLAPPTRALSTPCGAFYLPSLPKGYDLPTLPKGSAPAGTTSGYAATPLTNVPRAGTTSGYAATSLTNVPRAGTTSGYAATPLTNVPPSGTTSYPFKETVLKTAMSPPWSKTGYSNYHEARQSVQRTDMSPPLGQPPHPSHSHGRDPVYTSDISSRVHLTSTPVSRCVPPLQFGLGSHGGSFGREGHADNMRKGGEVGRGRDDSREVWGQRGDGYQRSVARARSYPRPHFEGRRGKF